MQQQSYSPYSRFRVGAALRATDGTVFVGTNVENVSYGLTVCAERVALGTAISSGYRAFHSIAVVTDALEPVCPCGACRQVLAEFGTHLQIYAVGGTGQVLETTLEALLPQAISPGELPRSAR